VLLDDDLAGQLQPGTGDAVLRRDLDSATPDQQVVSDALALVAILQPLQVERGIVVRPQPAYVGLQVIHQPPLLAARLTRPQQRATLNPCRLRQALRARIPPLLEETEDRLQRLRCLRLAR